MLLEERGATRMRKKAPSEGRGRLCCPRVRDLGFREMCFRLGLPLFNEISEFYYQTKKDLIWAFFKNIDMAVKQFFFFFF